MEVNMRTAICSALLICNFCFFNVLTAQETKDKNEGVSFEKKLLAKPPGEYDKNSVTFSPDGRSVAFVTYQGSYDVKYLMVNDRRGGNFSDITKIKYSPDGKKIAYVGNHSYKNRPGENFMDVIFWDLNSKNTAKQNGVFKSVQDLVFTSDSKKLFFVAQRQNDKKEDIENWSLYLWNIDDETPKAIPGEFLKISDLKIYSKQERKVFIPKVPTPFTKKTQISSEVIFDKYIIFTVVGKVVGKDSVFSQILAYDITSGKLLGTNRTVGVDKDIEILYYVISPNGELVVYVIGKKDIFEGGIQKFGFSAVHAWDLTTDTTRQSSEFDHGRVWNITFHPSEKKVAFGVERGSNFYWEVLSFEQK